MIPLEQLDIVKLDDGALLLAKVPLYKKRYEKNLMMPL
jgi:hypothetical protein